MGVWFGFGFRFWSGIGCRGFVGLRCRIKGSGVCFILELNSKKGTLIMRGSLGNLVYHRDSAGLLFIKGLYWEPHTGNPKNIAGT